MNCQRRFGDNTKVRAVAGAVACTAVSPPDRGTSSSENGGMLRICRLCFDLSFSLFDLNQPY